MGVNLVMDVEEIAKERIRAASESINKEDLSLRLTASS